MAHIVQTHINNTQHNNAQHYEVSWYRQSWWRQITRGSSHPHNVWTENNTTTPSSCSVWSFHDSIDAVSLNSQMNKKLSAHCCSDHTHWTTVQLKPSQRSSQTVRATMNLALITALFCAFSKYTYHYYLLFLISIAIASFPLVQSSAIGLHCLDPVEFQL